MTELLVALAAFALLALLVALALLVGWSWRIRRYASAFRVPARRDDCLTCRGDHPAHPVSLDPDGFDLPPGVARRGQTALLLVDIESTTLGRIFDPSVVVRQGSLGFRQCFEQGAIGRRYLNVSPLFQGDGGEPARVHLRGTRLRWKREATLVLFEGPRIDDEALLVTAPHPDDAEIAAFGVYARRRSWVATLTAGERGTSDLSAIAPRVEASRWNAHLRVWDSLAIPQLGDIPQERCVNLVYPDGQLRQMHARPAESFEIDCEDTLARASLRSRNRAPDFQQADRVCTWNGLVEDLRRLTERAAPSVIVCPHPILDSHPDHVFTTVALEEALRDGPTRDTRFLLYVVHMRDVPVYPFGPRDSLVSLPPWTDPEWLGDSILSHPLSAEVQRAKYFAVATAHDEGTYSGGERRELRTALTAIKRETSALLGGTGLRPASFLRRAPRPNEIFFVVSAEGLSELVNRALRRYPPDR
jgi:LmbE family N-acetylglucosaminyl deacetylase